MARSSRPHVQLFHDATTFPHLIPPFLAGSKRSCGHPSSPTLSFLCSAALRQRGSSCGSCRTFMYLVLDIRAVLLCVLWGESMSAYTHGSYRQRSCRRGFTPSVTMYSRFNSSFHEFCVSYFVSFTEHVDVRLDVAGGTPPRPSPMITSPPMMTAPAS